MRSPLPASELHDAAATVRATTSHTKRLFSMVTPVSRDGRSRAPLLNGGTNLDRPPGGWDRIYGMLEFGDCTRGVEEKTR